MKKIQQLSVLILLFSFFAACTTEPIDPNLASQLAANNANNNGGGNGNGSGGGNSGGGGGTPSGDYFPMALNNYWNFDNGTGTKSFKLIAIESINNFNYYKLDNPFLTGTTTGGFSPSDVTCHTRKENGDYIQRTYINKPETATSPGIVMQAFDAIFLKDYLNVGDSYTQNINQVTTTSFNNNVNTSTSVLTYKISIEEKNVPLTIGNQTFLNVIKTKTISSNSSGVFSISYNWFAKNVGPIKQVNYDPDGVTIDSQISILNYTLN